MSEVDAGGTKVSTFLHVKMPYHLSLDSEGYYALVAEYGNHRILLVHSDLQSQHARVVVDTNSDVKLWKPTRVFFNEATSKLYVAHSSTERKSRSDVVSLFDAR